MPKSALLATINNRPPVRNGELVSASVVQVSQIAFATPFRGDFQIVDSGRLIVGEHPDMDDRVIVGKFGLFGYDPDGVNTFAVVSKQFEPWGSGDVFAGYASGNHMLFDQSEGTFGVYSAASSEGSTGFIAAADGSLIAGNTDGAHMRWNTATKAIEVRRGDDVKISLDADGDGMFDGTVYAAGGRIYGPMQVDGLLRVGDVDGPGVSMGRFERTNESNVLVESSEIVATDASNLPWFRVVAGGGTAGGGYFHLGAPGDYAQRLTYDGSDLVLDGTLYARSGNIGGWTITAGHLYAGAGASRTGLIPGKYPFYAGDEDPEDAPFRVTPEGEVWLDNAHIAGTVQIGGEAGGWTIAADYLAKDTGDSSTSAGLAPLDYPFYAGATYALRATAPFRVTPAGALSASSGAVGGWTLADTSLTGGAATLHGSGYINLGAGNDIARLDATDATYRLWVGHATAASAPFSVSKAGALTATSGTVGGWTLGATALTDTAGTTGISSAVTAGDDIRFWAGHATPGSAPFRVTEAGVLTASSGTVGGWTLAAASLTGGNATLHNTGYLLLGTSNDIVRLDAANATYRLWAGHATAASAPFSVSKAGALVATSATITGAITASSGSVTGDFFVGSAAPRIKIDGANKYIESTNYASGVAGFRIEGATGNAEFNNLTARGSISTAVFIKSLISAFAGSNIVSKSASTLHNDLTVVTNGNTTTLDVKLQAGGAPFANTDRVRIKDGIFDLWMTVDAGTDQTTFWRYTATVQTGGGGGTITAGATVVDYGQSGNGYVLATAELTNAPYISIATHAGSPWTTTTERVRLGNLTGISGASGYGLWTDNGYFTGTVNVSNSAVSISTSGVVFDALVGKFDGSSLKWATGATEYLRIGTAVDLSSVTGTVINSSTTLRMTASGVEVYQPSSTAAVPVLFLDQADVSEEMIEFVSTAGTGNAIEAVGSKTLTTTHFIKVTVNGDTRYIPVGTIA